MEQTRTRAGCLTFVSGVVVAITLLIYLPASRFFPANIRNGLNAVLCSVIVLPGGLGAIGLLYYGAFFQEIFTDDERKALQHQAVAIILLLFGLYGLGITTGWGQAETGTPARLLAIVASALAGYVGVVTLKTRVTIVAPKGMSRKGKNAIIFGALDILVALVGILFVMMSSVK